MLTADLSDAESIVDTLHSVDRTIVSNAPAIKEGLRTFENYTADLRSKGGEIDSVMAKVDSAFAGFDKAVTKIEGVVPGFADGKADELFEKIQGIARARRHHEEEIGELTRGHPSLAARRQRRRQQDGGTPTPAAAPRPPRKPAQQKR